MTYYEVKRDYGYDVMLEGQSTEPILIGQFSVRYGSGIVIVGYLNELAKTHDRLKDMLLKLLKASLDGRNQSRIQDEVSKTLGFPGIDEFIKENYGYVVKKREKETKILTDDSQDDTKKVVEHETSSYQQLCGNCGKSMDERFHNPITGSCI